MDLLFESFKTSLLSLYNLAIIIFPLLIFIEFLKEIGIIDKLGKFFSPLTKVLKLPKDSIVPVTVGFLIGLTYGAGVIITAGKENNFSTKDLTKILILVGISHALVEETVIFVGIGANAFVVVAVRFFSAIIATVLYSKFSRGDEFATINSRRITQ